VDRALLARQAASASNLGWETVLGTLRDHFHWAVLLGLCGGAALAEARSERERSEAEHRAVLLLLATRSTAVQQVWMLPQWEGLSEPERWKLENTIKRRLWAIKVEQQKLQERKHRLQAFFSLFRRHQWSNPNERALQALSLVIEQEKLMLANSYAKLDQRLDQVIAVGDA
jgi:hypothetical protein